MTFNPQFERLVLECLWLILLKPLLPSNDYVSLRDKLVDEIQDYLKESNAR